MKSFHAMLCISTFLATPSFSFDFSKDTSIFDTLRPTAKAFKCSVVAGFSGRLNDEVYLFGYGYRLADAGAGLSRDLDIENRSPDTTSIGIGPTTDFTIGRLYQLILLRTEQDTLGFERLDFQDLFDSENCEEALKASRSLR